jgi:hypothetical protein
MTTIHGRHGRTYIDGKRVQQPVEHAETRTPSQVRLARMVPVPPGPSGKLPPGENPWLHTIKAEQARHPYTWQFSDAGKRKLGELQRQADEWQQQYQAKCEQAKFAASVEPMVQHSLKTLAQAESDSEVTRAELDQLRANVDAIRNGTMSAEQYKTADQVWRDSRRAKIEERAHKNDDQIRTLTGERDALLSEAWKSESEAEPVPEAKAIEQPDQRVTDPAEIARLNQALTDTRQRIASGQLRRGAPPR